ncbi:MAG: serine/threonine protein kinase [Labilithrix sp.]|nr:serine/threonine protein kinase [Labilithrix sp.]MCW5815999.1 serine/threonine protein kinase [Labilithrix sp.]
MVLHAGARQTPSAGETLGRKYRVLRPLGGGGMGVVLEAENVATGARVAIKLLRDTLSTDAESVSRFFREARATARLKSRFVVTIYDVDTDESGAPYIVMEFLEGRDLAAEIRSRPSIAVDELTAWLVQAAAGLARAHAAGIVHRDLKPANLFLVSEPANLVKVVDFGVSKMASESELTQSGDVLGTSHYMSPEQLRNSRTVDARADVWALGVVAYRALEGRMPFEGSSAEVIAKILGPDACTPIRRPDVPPAVRDAVMRALEKDPARRFPSVEALASAIAPFARRSAPVVEALESLPPPAQLAQLAPTTRQVLGSTLKLPPPAPPISSPGFAETEIVSVSPYVAPPKTRWPLVAAAIGATLVVAGSLAVGVVLVRRTHASAASPSSSAVEDERASPPPSAAAPEPEPAPPRLAPIDSAAPLASASSSDRSPRPKPPAPSSPSRSAHAPSPAPLAPTTNPDRL